MREVLDLQDVECCGDDMCEQDPLSMQIPTMSVRETVLHSLKNQMEEYLTHLKQLDNMNLYMSFIDKKSNNPSSLNA